MTTCHEVCKECKCILGVNCGECLLENEGREKNSEKVRYVLVGYFCTLRHSKEVESFCASEAALWSFNLNLCIQSVVRLM